jgi:NADH-ubiquinone oxidoreductase chain 1
LDCIYLWDFSGSLATHYGTGYEGTEMFNSPLLEGMISGLTIGIKSCIMIFVFIWVRASFPRIRFDQLMSFSWTILLPIIIAFIVLIPCIVYSFEIIPSNISLL